MGQALARTADDLAEIVSRVGSPSCQVYYDVGNATAQGADPAAEMRKLGPRIKMLHVKDIRPGGRGRGPAIIGQGAVDWPAIARAARDIAYDGFLTLEVAGTVETADDIAVQSRDALGRFGLYP